MKEEQLNEAAGRDWCENVLDRDLKSITKQAFKRGARWHESLPLAERLTEEEKDKVVKLYLAKRNWRNHHVEKLGKAKDMMSRSEHELNYFRYKDMMGMLEYIFGSNLFTPTEQ